MRAQMHGGNFEDEVQLGAPVDGARERRLGGGGIAHQANEDLGVGFIGDHVGRASAGDARRC